ncbi:DUF2332 domain-containing protein [Pseudooceanicola sp. C21-150M6]|uniref:DUF2332 domain-containing protein n=1 Tax=Pseudooceanicola sp. C21-150M6 TaxID=3434355 RepID=UPI003D7F7561
MTLPELFVAQAGACGRLGSPFMDRMLHLCARNMPPDHEITRRLQSWPGDATALGAAIVLRFAGALHALVLRDLHPDLTAAYPPNTVDDTTLWSAIRAAMGRHQTEILHWLDSAPQTNEVRRSAAMIAAACLLAERCPGLPLRLSELGASAGLNLWFDHYALSLPVGTTRGAQDPVITLTPDWQGPLPPDLPFTIADRRGVDLNPLSPDDPQARLRLRSYTWPDQADRMARLDAALTIATPVVDRGDAGDWLHARLARPTPGQIDLVFHTIAWQYFPASTDAACRAALADAATRATPDTPLAHLWVEAAPDQKLASARLTLWTGAPEPEILPLGQMDPHGRQFIAAPPFRLS